MAASETVGDVVRRRRQMLGLSQEAAAQAAGVSRRAWSEIEQVKRSGSPATLRAMETALGIPEGSLVALLVQPRDPELAAIKAELVDMIRQLMVREDLEEIRLDIVRRRHATIQRRLTELEAAASDRHDGQPQ